MRPILIRLLLGYAAIGTSYFVAWLVAGNVGYTAANIILPIGFLLVSAWGGARLIQGTPRMIWSPLPWFLAAGGLYYGLGPLAHYFGSAEAVYSLNVWYEPSEWEIWRTNVLNGLGMMLVVGGFLLALRFKGRSSLGGAIGFNPREAGRLVVMFLSGGVIMSAAASVLAWVQPFGLYPPSSFGQVTNYLFDATLIILVLLVMRGQKRWWPVLAVFGTCLAVRAILTFSKLEMILVLFFLLVGVLSSKPRIPILAAGFLVASSVYLFSVGLVSYGRKAVGEDVNASNRLEAVRSYTARTDEDMLSTESLWWLRLSYTSAQAFAMNAYDRGAAGNTVGLAPYTLIPRFFWPDKPFMTSGVEFNVLLTGSGLSQSAPGFFAETYWNGGWLLFAGACLYVGLVFGILTLTGAGLLARGELAWLPCGCVAIFIGLRPDDWFAATYVGGVVFLVWLYVILFHLLRVRAQREKPPARWWAQSTQALQGSRGTLTRTRDRSPGSGRR